jgi:hypothetical protein
MRWTNEFLDKLRNEGDDLADEHLARLIKDGEIDLIQDVFKKMNSNDDEPLHNQFPVLDNFFEQTQKLPSHTDFARIRKGEEMFARNAFPAALVLLTKSLPEGYAAPNLSIILNISKNLEQHAYRRLLQVMQMLLNVAALRGFEDGGRAVITAQKLRLLHAGIRHISYEQRKGYIEKYGKPVNHEDMLATIMGFSLLVIYGLRSLKCAMTPQEEEDYYYMWQIFALMMGIHPAGQPESMAYIPESVKDAGLFYKAFAERHYRAAAENPDGVQLTHANLTMLKKLIPTFFRLIGFGFAPQIYTYHLLGAEAAKRVGIHNRGGKSLLKLILFNLPAVVLKLNNLFFSIHHYHTTHHYLGELVFQNMINNKFGHEITFTVPDTLSDVKKMVMN